MDNVQNLLLKLGEIEATLRYQFKNKDYLTLAFVHRSYLNENNDISNHNERLEYLGDTVLGLIISEFLYNSFKNMPEGELSTLRASLVDAHACTQYMETLALESYILMSKGEHKNWNKGQGSILADLFEALLGAIFLDGGLDAAKHFLFDHFHKKITQMMASPTQNWKAILQDHCQKTYHKTPTYDLISQEGPDHDKVFEIAVKLEEKELGTGKGSSKKEAQQNAAEIAMNDLNRRI